MRVPVLREITMRLLIAVALCVLAGLATSADTKPLAGIGVLRLDEAIRNSKVYTGRVEQLKKDKAEAESSLKQMEEKLQQLNGQLEVLSPNSDKFAQAQEEMEVIKTRREFLAKRVRGLLDKRHGAVLKEAYDSLRSQLKDFCKEKGLALVTLAPNPDIAAASSSDVQMQLGFQTSLYFDPSLDITEAFIAFANARLAATGHDEKAPAPAPVGK
jgi:Skp family chaperone for outer membrane proteins